MIQVAWLTLALVGFVMSVDGYRLCRGALIAIRAAGRNGRVLARAVLALENWRMCLAATAAALTAGGASFIRNTPACPPPTDLTRLQTAAALGLVLGVFGLLVWLDAMIYRLWRQERNP